MRSRAVLLGAGQPGSHVTNKSIQDLVGGGCTWGLGGVAHLVRFLPDPERLDLGVHTFSMEPQKRHAILIRLVQGKLLVQTKRIGGWGPFLLCLGQDLDRDVNYGTFKPSPW